VNKKNNFHRVSGLKEEALQNQIIMHPKSLKSHWVPFQLQLKNKTTKQLHLKYKRRHLLMGKKMKTLWKFNMNLKMKLSLKERLANLFNSRESF
jgi:hypothetical protein